ncbi:hypothetical protein L7F22_040393 [Adiantum nelumboides]|nr:hypothetical protein [Adiantum nelumboides]MCO5586453.1 hypothetical protein [Adiantum nelumboides]
MAMEVTDKKAGLKPYPQSNYYHPHMRMRPYTSTQDLRHGGRDRAAGLPTATQGGVPAGRASSSARRKVDAEHQRKRRVSHYKSFAVETRMKDSFRRGLLWFRHKYMQVKYGWSF